ncbi:MAG: hypothetical protein KatS3mg105_1350 [Gemmatales bacterium]|nr:MAG: hypothetical protein KatS3mg105_1350 [Gemmatales bacterium]
MRRVAGSLLLILIGAGCAGSGAARWRDNASMHSRPLARRWCHNQACQTCMHQACQNCPHCAVCQAANANQVMVVDTGEDGGIAVVDRSTLTASPVKQLPHMSDMPIVGDANLSNAEMVVPEQQGEPSVEGPQIRQVSTTPSRKGPITMRLPHVVAEGMQESQLPPGPPVKLVNSHRISLDYKIENVGPSGVSGVELWYTRDGRKWIQHPMVTEPKPPFIIDVSEDGLYGFTLLARNGIGLTKKPPMMGDEPLVWVKVDRQPPQVELTDLQLGLKNDILQLTVRWRASDENLAEEPITLSYATTPSGPWIPITQQIANSGHFVWRLPANTPSQVYIRAEAVDQVGNKGIAIAQQPVCLDLTPPSVQIVTVGALPKP